MSLSAGTRLGAYQNTAQIGAGGRARCISCANLDRQVAIKILPELFAHEIADMPTSDQTSTATSASIVVVLNWFEELKRLVPVD